MLAADSMPGLSASHPHSQSAGGHRFYPCGAGIRPHLGHVFAEGHQGLIRSRIAWSARFRRHPLLVPGSGFDALGRILNADKRILHELNIAPIALNVKQKIAINASL